MPFVSDGWLVLGSIELHPGPVAHHCPSCEARAAYCLLSAGEVKQLGDESGECLPQNKRAERQPGGSRGPEPDCACAEPAAPRTGSRRGRLRAARGEYCGRLAGWQVRPAGC